MAISGARKADNESWIVGEKEDRSEEADHDEVIRVEAWLRGSLECIRM